MSVDRSSHVTKLLDEIRAGDHSAVNRLFPLVYDELRDIANRYLASERKAHTLQPTALVHEVYMKLVDQTRVDWQGRTHLLAVGAQAMRRLLVDHARHNLRLKRGGDRLRVEFDDVLAVSRGRDQDVLSIDEALVKLARVDPRQARIVELRFFGGLSVEEVSHVLGVSKRTIEAEWTATRAWLRRELGGAAGDES
jgi:RNA polymerase sigma factor (TIGR02999 family)